MKKYNNEKILKRLKKLERCVYDKRMRFINLCSNYNDFVDYVTDGDPNSKEIVVLDDKGYLILNVNERKKFMEVVDIICLDGSLLKKYLKIIEYIIKKYNIKKVYFTIVFPEKFDIKRIIDLYIPRGILNVIYNYVYDYDFNKICLEVTLKIKWGYIYAWRDRFFK